MLGSAGVSPISGGVSREGLPGGIEQIPGGVSREGDGGSDGWSWGGTKV